MVGITPAFAASYEALRPAPKYRHPASGTDIVSGSPSRARRPPFVSNDCSCGSDDFSGSTMAFNSFLTSLLSAHVIDTPYMWYSKEIYDSLVCHAEYCYCVPILINLHEEMAMPAKRDSSDYVYVKLRMKESLRRQLSQAAGNRGGSMNDEGVSRLQQSFTDEERLFKDQHTMALIRLLVGAIQLIEERTGERWTTDRHTQKAVTAAVVGFLNSDLGVPFNKPAWRDDDGGILNDDFGLLEAPQTAIDDVFMSLLKMRDVPEKHRDVIVEMIQTFRARRFPKTTAPLNEKDST
jgi:hypothetical protein